GQDCSAGVRCGQHWTQDSIADRAQDRRHGRQREHPQQDEQANRGQISNLRQSPGGQGVGNFR
ncbi:unnamed protein product, partial [Laminaria digitata]